MGIESVSGRVYVNEYNNNATSGQIKKAEQNESIFTQFTDWYNDKECTDTNDDGELKAGEFVEEYAKGLFLGIADTVVEHPVMTGLAVAGTVAATVLTGGAIAPFLIGAGIVSSGFAIGKGAYDYATAETDGDAKTAARQMGTGTTGAVLSVFGAKTALNSASAAGVKSAQGAENMNALQATVQCFKSVPEALKVSASNAKGNILTLATGTVHKGSNKLQGGKEGVSKATSADVKKLDLSGTQEEVLARYSDSGMFVGDDGNYYIPNKWSANEPYLAKDGNVLMKYDTDDFAVCAKNIFEKSYGTTESYNSGNFQYSTVDSLKSDAYINATKQAQTKGITLPEGTKVQTLEGPRTVQKGEIVAIDVEGNPYVQPVSKFESKNILSDIILKPNNLAVDSAKNTVNTAVIETELDNIAE